MPTRLRVRPYATRKPGTAGRSWAWAPSRAAAPVWCGSCGRSTGASARVARRLPAAARPVRGSIRTHVRRTRPTDNPSRLRWRWPPRRSCVRRGRIRTRPRSRSTADIFLRVMPSRRTDPRVAAPAHARRSRPHHPPDLLRETTAPAGRHRLLLVQERHPHPRRATTARVPRSPRGARSWSTTPRSCRTCPRNPVAAIFSQRRATIIRLASSPATSPTTTAELSTRGEEASRSSTRSSQQQPRRRFGRRHRHRPATSWSCVPTSTATPPTATAEPSTPTRTATSRSSTPRSTATPRTARAARSSPSRATSRSSTRR